MEEKKVVLVDGFNDGSVSVKNFVDFRVDENVDIFNYIPLLDKVFKGTSLNDIVIEGVLSFDSLVVPDVQVFFMFLVVVVFKKTVKEKEN